MAVGKGSLSRVVAKTNKSEIVTLLPNNVVDLDVSAVTFKKVVDNEGMTQSVKTYGVILPIIVEETEKGLKVIDGAKRLTALKELGVKTVKAVVIKADGKKVSGELKRFEPKERIVEKIVEVEKPVEVEKIVEIERVVEKTVEVPVIKKLTRVKYLRNPLEFAIVGLLGVIIGILIGLLL